MAEAEWQQPDVTIVANDIGPVGGMERQLTEVITGLLEAGHQITVISRTCSLADRPGLRWIRVPGPSRPFAIAYPWFLLIGSLLVRLRARGVVHSTGSIVLNRVPICTVHFCHQALVAMPAFSRASRGGPLHRLNAAIAAAMKRLGERWCYRPGRADRLVGVSEGVARELREHFPAMRARILMIPNGVDTDVFRPAEEPTAGNRERDGLRMLFVGSEWERKGLRPAIEALKRSPGTSLTVVGNGDVAAYRELAAGIGVEDRVSFAGTITEVAPWYRRTDVFLLPTAYETFSLVTFEAAASGLPLLVTKVNGVEDLIRDGENGWFIERDAEDIGERLRNLRAEPGLRKAMGEAARRDSLAYSWTRVVKSYRELYRDSSRSATNAAT